MGVGRKYRGAYEKVLRQYAYDRLHGREDIDRERAFITWSTCPQPALDAVRAICREEGHFEELLETQAGCTSATTAAPTRWACSSSARREKQTAPSPMRGRRFSMPKRDGPPCCGSRRPIKKEKIMKKHPTQL